jgi:hypothetical protein
MLLCIVSKYRGFGAFSMNKTGSWRKLFRTYASVASQGAGSQHLLKPLFGMKLETVYNDGHCGIIDLDEVCIRTRWESVGLKYVVKDLYPSIFLDAESSKRKVSAIILIKKKIEFSSCIRKFIGIGCKVI